MSTSTSTSIPPFKASFISTCLSLQILRFGSFTLNSGRTSPYFFNAGSFNTASRLSILATAYASAIASHAAFSSKGEHNTPSWDVIFGPAYKGIPLAATTALKLFEREEEKYRDVGYAFNRKEAKDHGEGGNIVGADLNGKRVLIIDDVITAGTAIREAVEIIGKAGGKVAGIVVALDRQERVTNDGKSAESAIMWVEKELGVPVVAIITLDDLIEGVSEEAEKRGMVEYREKYGATKASID